MTKTADKRKADVGFEIDEVIASKWKKAEEKYLTQAKDRKVTSKTLVITPPNIQAIKFEIVGLTPLVQRPIVVRYQPTCDFYVSSKGWRGIPVYGIRKSLFGACKFEGLTFGTEFKSGMLGIQPDGFDQVEGTPLVRITKGKPRDASEIDEKLKGGIVYSKGWEASVVIEFDADMFKPQGVIEIITIAGKEIGLGRIRPARDVFKRREIEPDDAFNFGTFAVSV